jgi:hypothetical protein
MRITYIKRRLMFTLGLICAAVGVISLFAVLQQEAPVCPVAVVIASQGDSLYSIGEQHCPNERLRMGQLVDIMVQMNNGPDIYPGQAIFLPFK